MFSFEDSSGKPHLTFPRQFPLVFSQRHVYSPGLHSGPRVSSLENCSRRPWGSLPPARACMTSSLCSLSHWSDLTGHFLLRTFSGSSRCTEKNSKFCEQEAPRCSAFVHVQSLFATDYFETPMRATPSDFSFFLHAGLFLASVPCSCQDPRLACLPDSHHRLRLSPPWFLTVCARTSLC